jgi:hypothetical protein
VDRLRDIELRVSEIRAKTSSIGIADDPTPFRQVLDQVSTSRSVTGTMTAAGAANVAGPLQPPEALASFGNGRIPTSLLESIGQGDHRLSADAAAAFKAMAADARRAGVTLPVSDSYRSLDEQMAMADREGRYAEGGLAAEPGTSAHGWGLAVDLDLNTRSSKWMRENASKYGFVEDVAREPWHWTYRAPPTSPRTNGSTKGFW